MSTSEPDFPLPDSPPATVEARLSRAIHFSCAYAYEKPNASVEENGQMYGRWASPDGMGCNFRAECTFQGPVDRLTGMVINLMDVDSWMKAAADEFDHRDVRGHARLKSEPPTADAIARAFRDAVLDQIPRGLTCRLVRTRLYEGSLAWTEIGEPQALSEK